MDAQTRFLDKVSIPDDQDDHWIWTASVDGNGAPKFWYRGRLRSARRVAYEWWVIEEELPPDIEVGAGCRIERCVNPAHLVAGNHQFHQQRSPLTNISKQYCPQGHLYNADNTHYRIETKRYGPKTYQSLTRKCRTCDRERSKQHWRAVTGYYDRPAIKNEDDMAWQLIKPHMRNKAVARTMTVFRSGHITWDPETHELLGCPERVELLLDRDGGRLGLRAAPQKDLQSFKVHPRHDRPDRFIIYTSHALTVAQLVLADAYRQRIQVEDDIVFIDLKHATLAETKAE